MMIYPKKAELGSKERDSTALCPIRPGCSVIEVLASFFFIYQRYLTISATATAHVTGHDLSLTSKMTDRPPTGHFTSK